MRGDLNYHHLRYFRAVAREGSIAKACLKLHVAQPTISGQLKELETSIGEQLFARVGRHLELTETGRMVLRYCDEIFAIGDELVEAVEGHGVHRLPLLQVGIADALPKLIAHRLLAPALAIGETVRLRCLEDPTEKLVAALAIHDLDLVLSDQPALGIQAVVHNHLLGTSAVALFGTKDFAHLAGKSVADLRGQPMVLPAPGSSLRRLIEDFFTAAHQTIRIVAECEDNALLLAMGMAGVGLVPGTLALTGELKRMYGLSPLITIPQAVQQFYAITVDRRFQHPGIAAITSTARDALDQPLKPT
jgi:LysR family transcriptional regulator, transcriptional activator of nhaA